MLAEQVLAQPRKNTRLVEAHNLLGLFHSLQSKCLWLWGIYPER